MEKEIRKYKKDYILQNQSLFPWNIILRMYQFTQEELLASRDYCDIYDIVRFQEEATYDFIYEYFKADVDESDRLDWEDVKRFTLSRYYNR
jgi:hypothetical protein